ncbi:hypothetical protein DL96DRAFT_1646380 [Flagelloscypha sp. PMI_526]|nr:hypothetical protein DL96DRAFT_1646380 [Flagelloscypha sp. PMI_526]
MPLSSSPYVLLACNSIAAFATAAGINFVVRPTQLLPVWGLRLPTDPNDRKTVKTLATVFGIRDIFMGAAMFAVAHSGNMDCLGMVQLATAGVAIGDGLVAISHGVPSWTHWSGALVFATLGGILLGAAD